MLIKFSRGFSYIKIKQVFGFIMGIHNGGIWKMFVIGIFALKVYCITYCKVRPAVVSTKKMKI